MAVYVVRHGCAGDKRQWPGHDDDRPLDATGADQAEALADVLGTAPVGRVVSSPAVRCRQSVELLARRLGRPVELHDALRADATATSVEALLAAVGVRIGVGAGAGGGAVVVLCTHGEVMRPLLVELRKADVPIAAGEDDDGWLLAKGTGWRLTFDADVAGRVVALEHLVPEGRHPCPFHPD